MYEYYVSIMYDTPIYKRSVAGACYKLDYKLNSSENIMKFMKDLKDEGYKNAVILFFKLLNKDLGGIDMSLEAIVWSDSRGWKYKVMGDLAGTFKGRYQDNKHNGNVGWKGMRQMERRETFEQAQEDLNQYAKSKGWKPITI